MRLYRDGQQKGKIRWKYNIKKATKKPIQPASKEKNENSIKGSFVYEYEEEEKLREFKSHWFARYIKGGAFWHYAIQQIFSKNRSLQHIHTYFSNAQMNTQQRSDKKNMTKNSGKPTKGIWGVYCANSIKKIFIIQ